MTLSTLSRGSPEEKLRWAFRLYDCDKDGFISPVELFNIIKATHELIGKQSDPPVDNFWLKDQTKLIFRVFNEIKMSKRNSITGYLEI